jgi:cobalt-zinc-cadmium efflux system outer membrane protein
MRLNEEEGVFRLFRISWIRASGLAVALAFMAEPGAAQETLDVDRYVEIVLRSHPTLRLSGGLEEAARAERKAVRLLPDLEVAVGIGRGRSTEGPDFQGAESSFSLRQTIPWPAAFSAGIRAGDRAADVLLSSAEGARWEIEIEARRAFTRLISARALLEIARAMEEDARSLRDLVARRAELGESRESDRIRTAVEWLRQQRNLLTAERDVAAAEAVVRSMAVEPLPRPLEIRGALPPASPPQDRETLLSRLQERNPRLRAARAEAEKQKALLSAARWGRAPDIGLSLFREREVDRVATGFQLGFVVPFWNANQGQISRARAAVSLATAEADRLHLDLLAELEARLRDLEVAAGQVSLLDNQILPAATRSLDLARLSYEEGETALVDLLDVERTHRDAERELVESRLALALAAAELQRLVGPDFNPWR